MYYFDEYLTYGVTANDGFIDVRTVRERAQ